MCRIIFDIMCRDGPVLYAGSVQTLIQPHPLFVDTQIASSFGEPPSG